MLPEFLFHIWAGGLLFLATLTRGCCTFKPKILLSHLWQHDTTSIFLLFTFFVLFNIQIAIFIGIYKSFMKAELIDNRFNNSLLIKLRFSRVQASFVDGHFSSLLCIIDVTSMFNWTLIKAPPVAMNNSHICSRRFFRLLFQIQDISSDSGPLYQPKFMSSKGHVVDLFATKFL